MQKAVCGYFELAVWIDVISINISCFFTIITTVSISCNWTDELLFTYKMALCTSRSHSFVCGRSIVIKFRYLADIYLAINWWKNTAKCAWSFSRNSSFLRGLFYYATPCRFHTCWTSSILDVYAECTIITHVNCRSAWVGFSSQSVCLFVRSITQKQMIPKCSNLV